MERKEINEIQEKIVNLVNVVFDVENLINNNKMLVRIKKDTIIIKKNTHHKFKNYIIFNNNLNIINYYNNKSFIIQNDIQITHINGDLEYWVNTRSTYLQYLEFIKLSIQLHLPNFKKIIIKF